MPSVDLLPEPVGRGSRIVRLRFPWLTYLVALLPAVVLTSAGCQKDSRISVEALRKMEAELATIEPVGVSPEDLALAEVHPHRLGPSDVLGITLIGLIDPYSENRLLQRVDQNGKISLPLVGEVAVGELDLLGAEQAIEDALVPTFVKSLSVYLELIGPEQTTVVVVGAAGQPGLVTLPSDRRNVLYAVAAAGGFVPGASGRVCVRPIQTAREEVTYDLTDINDLRRALLTPALESGDMLTVEAAEPSVVFVTGLVNMPGPVPVPVGGDVSLVRCVAASGGLRDFLDPQEATIWRRLPNGEQVRVKLELAEIMEGKGQDIALLPGDVLDVPHTLDTRFREWFANNIRIGPFGVTGVYDPVADYRARILRGDDGDDGDVVRRALLQTLGTGIPELVIPPVVAPTGP